MYSLPLNYNMPLILHWLDRSKAITGLIPMMALRGTSVLLQFLLQLVIARLTGTAGIATIQVYQSWVSVLGETNCLGLANKATKFTALAETYAKIKQQLITCSIIITIIWLAGGLLFVLGLWTKLKPSGELNTVVIACLAISVLCFAIMRLVSSSLKALDKVTTAIVLENILATIIVLAILAIGFSQGQLNTQITADTIIVVLTVALTLATSACIFCCWNALKCKQVQLVTLYPNSLGQRIRQLCNKETLFFWGTSVLSIVFLNAPFLLASNSADLHQVGLFAVAYKCVTPITIILLMLSAVFGPKFAIAGKAFNGSDLLANLRQTQIASLAFYLPVVAILMFFSDQVLNLFGEEFVGAKKFLYLLIVAQLINALTGLPGVMLNMIGKSHIEFIGTALFCLAMFVDGYITGEVYGLYSVAICYGLAISAKNIWSYYWAIQVIKQISNTAKRSGNDNEAA
jgi:O-antigen/teichoic acid export membrane protein